VVLGRLLVCGLLGSFRRLRTRRSWRVDRLNAASASSAGPKHRTVLEFVDFSPVASGGHEGF